MVKKVLIFIGLTIAAFVLTSAVLIGLGVFSKKAQEDLLIEVLNEYRDKINEELPNVDEIYESSKNVYSDGYYAYVEKAVKEYLCAIYYPYLSIQKLHRSGLFKDGITKELIESDQPNFEKTLEKIDNMDDYLTLTYLAASTLFSREEAMSYLEEGLDESYIALYEEQVAPIYNDQQLSAKLMEYYESVAPKCEAYKQIIEFLRDNNGSWHLDGENVVFKTTALTNQYNQLLASVN